MYQIKEKYKIFCCTHINAEIVNDPLYELLHTGRAYDKQFFAGVRGDDTGDNISNKKDIYDGLLTGMYWIWKNTNYEYTGICSYRGYLGIDKRPISLKKIKIMFEEKGYDFVAARLDLEYNISKDFELGQNLFYYNYLHDPLLYTERVIKDRYPYMLDAYYYCMQHHIINYRHTFIAKKKYFDEYAEWVFDFINEYIKYAQKVNYIIGARFFGYLVERLERVWLLYKGVNLAEFPVVFISNRNSGVIDV